MVLLKLFTKLLLTNCKTAFYLFDFHYCCYFFFIFFILSCEKANAFDIVINHTYMHIYISFNFWDCKA